MRFGAFCRSAWEFRNSGQGRKGDEICECCNEVDVYHPKICLAAKERRESVASTKKEMWRKKYGRIKMAWEGGGSESRGMENRKGVVHRRFERAHHFYREGGERRGEGGEGEDASLFDVAGETKNRG